MIDYREDNKWIVYIHTSPSGKYYVGITGRKPEQRWGFNGNGYKKQHKHFYNAIKKYGWDKFKHEIIASHLTKKETSDFEVCLIENLKTNNKKYGYNMTVGGECGNVKPLIPVYQYDLNGKYLKSFKSAAEASREIGCHRTQITRVCKGKGLSIYGFMWRYYKRDKIKKYEKSNHKQVDQYNYNCKLIKTYKSIAEATNAIGVSEDTIVRCCKGENKTAGGYVWRYHGEKPEIFISKNSIIQFDMSKNYINEFSSINDCMDKTYMNYYQLKKCYDNKSSYNSFYFIRKIECELSSDGSFLF